MTYLKTSGGNYRKTLRIVEDLASLVTIHYGRVAVPRLPRLPRRVRASTAAVGFDGCARGPRLSMVGFKRARFGMQGSCVSI